MAAAPIPATDGFPIWVVSKPLSRLAGVSFLPAPYLHAMLNFFSSVLLISGFAASAQPLMTPSRSVALKPDRCMIYCPTLQLAWDQLTNHVGAAIRMEGEDPLVDELNRGTVPTSVMPASGFVSVAGKNSTAFRARLKRLLKEKFKSHAPELPAAYSHPAVQFVMYAHLQKKLPFPKKFIRAKKPFEFHAANQTTLVHSFGVSRQRSSDFGEQVHILDYVDEDSFTIKLLSSAPDQFVVLSKMKAPNTMNEAIRHVTARVVRKPEAFTRKTVNGKEEIYLNYLSAGDTLVIPVMRINLSTNLAQLCGRKLKNKGFEDQMLIRATQNFRFELDESGAAVRSTGDIIGGFGGSSRPRAFVFNKPFLLSLWKRDRRQPYAAIWVGSSEALVASREEDP